MKELNKLANAIGVTVSKDATLAFLFYQKAVLYDTQNFMEIWNFKVPPYTEYAAISNDNSLLAIKNSSGKISLWDINSKTLIKNFPMKKSSGKTCLFSPDDRYLVDADVDGNIMVIDIANLSFRIIKSYFNCMINGMSFNSETNEFIFSFLKKITDNDLNKEGGNSYAVIWKYPFEENEPNNHLIPMEVGRFSPVKNIPNSMNYYSYNESELIILNNSFELNSKFPAKLDYGFKPVCCSNDGENIITIKHGISLYSLNNFKQLSSYFIKGAMDVAFLGNTNIIIVASKNGSCVIDINTGF